MNSKAISILTVLIFVVVSWYVYGLYSYIQNLIFALLVSVMALVSILLSYKSKDADGNEFIQDKSIDKIRIVFSALTMIMFLAFIALSMKHGGSATSAEDAMDRYENYVEGAYYLSSHGDFTTVSYDVWIRMKIVQQIVMPSFVIMFIWNFAHGVKAKGLKYMLSGREKDSL